MVQQDYRVIADRDKGDEPQWDEVRLGDRTTSVVISGEGQGSMTRLVHIERPVPTTDSAPVGACGEAPERDWIGGVFCTCLPGHGGAHQCGDFIFGEGVAR